MTLSLCNLESRFVLPFLLLVNKYNLLLMEERELFFLFSFTGYFVVSVLRNFLFLMVPLKGCVILLLDSLVLVVCTMFLPLHLTNSSNNVARIWLTLHRLVLYEK